MASDEFSVIQRYFRNLSGEAMQVVRGPGDDCAVLQLAPAHELCVSTDTLLSGVHFPLDASADVVASRTLAANLSDLAAMGATPHGFVLALTMPDVDEPWLALFSQTLKAMSDAHHIPLVGGNLTKGQLSLTITVLGQVPDGEAVYRTGANIGDAVFVTGTLGDAGRGLALVAQNASPSYLTARYTNPTPRIEMGESLRGVATAMVDISDGLVADVAHIANESGVGVTLRLDDLPLSLELEAAVGRDEALQLALAAGDDYELCFTAPDAAQATIESLAGELDLSVTRIGQVTQSAELSVQVVDVAGNLVEASGYRHF